MVDGPRAASALVQQHSANDVDPVVRVVALEMETRTLAGLVEQPVETPVELGAAPPLTLAYIDGEDGSGRLRGAVG